MRDDELVKINFCITRGLRKKIKQRAYNSNRTMTDIVVKAIENFINEKTDPRIHELLKIFNEH